MVRQQTKADFSECVVEAYCFFQILVTPFGFTQQYHILLLKTYNAYTLFPGALSCNWAHLV